MSWGPIRGHDLVVDQLRAALAEDRFPHAWLFVGPGGIGKRAFAARLAQALLCDRHDERALDPCGDCPGCTQAAASTHPDLYVVARPEDRHELPIALIRQLISDLGLKPSRGRRKVAILDDADDLNDESANALLKTLEEPPPGSTLILIGTSPELQLDTIRSRCRVVRFEPLSTADLAPLLVEQGVSNDPDHAHSLADRAGGSLTLARALADPAFGAFRRELIEAIAVADDFDAPRLARRLESFIKEAGKESIDQRARARLIFAELARFFRALLWQTSGAEPPSTDPDDRQVIFQLASRLEPEDVFLLIERSLEADYHLARKVYLPVLLDSFTHDLGQAIRAH